MKDKRTFHVVIVLSCLYHCLPIRPIPSPTAIHNHHLYQHCTLPQRRLPMRLLCNKAPIDGGRRQRQANERCGSMRVKRLSDYTSGPRFKSDVVRPKRKRVLRLQTTGTIVSRFFADRENASHVPTATSQPSAHTMPYNRRTIWPPRILSLNTLLFVHHSVSVEPLFHPSSSPTLTTVDRNDEGGQKDVNGLVLSLLYKSVCGQVFKAEMGCRSNRMVVGVEVESEALLM